MKITPLKKHSLYLVATPIGNIKDITIRALEVIKQADLLLAEDTRSIPYLLNEYQIKPARILSYHAKNEEERLPLVLSALKEGQSVALVSEAGTPLVCDPGILLVKKVLEHPEINLISIPGASAFTMLLPLSGFSLGDFYFAGFLSSKTIKRQNQLKHLTSLKTVIILYESVHRFKETLELISGIFPARMEIVVGRELTKEFETVYRGSLEDMNKIISSPNFVCKGEFCILLNNN